VTAPAAQEPQPPSLNDLIRGTPAPAAEQTPEQAREAALVTAAQQASAHDPATVAGLLVTSHDGDPDALVRTLKGSHPYLFRRTDVGAGEGRMDLPAPEGQHPLSGVIRRHSWGA